MTNIIYITFLCRGICGSGTLLAVLIFNNVIARWSAELLKKSHGVEGGVSEEFHVSYLV